MSLEKSLSSQMLVAHPDDTAALLEGLPDEAVVALLAAEPAAAVAEVLTRLAPNRAAAALAGLESGSGPEIVLHLGLDEAADLVRRMEVEPRDRFVATLEPELARPIRTLLEFPEGTAGSLMDSRVLALPLDVTAAEAIDQIRRTPDNIRYNLYVVDRERRLVGVLNLRELLLAARNEPLGDIARADVMSIQGQESKRAILTHVAWREAHSLPVVDRSGVYLGAIRYRTWRLLVEDAMREETGRDATTADALGDLFSAGMAGFLGALTHLAARPTGGSIDGGE
jgi:magnesium transporter